MHPSYPSRVSSTEVCRSKLDRLHTNAQDLFFGHLHSLNQAFLLTTAPNPLLGVEKLNLKAILMVDSFQEFASENKQVLMYSKSPMDYIALPWPPSRQDQPRHLIPAHLGSKGGV